MNALLSLQQIEKSYGTNRVLRGVSLSIDPGEVVSIIGENGAGKSTLARIIAGVAAADAGHLQWQGRPVSFSSPRDAIKRGIGMVHQELNLAENLTVTENLMLGREETHLGIIRSGERTARALACLAELAPGICPRTQVALLSIAERQMIEIARALSQQAKLLILDEPTSSLSERESARLLSVIRTLKLRGVSILYVSHRLSEVLEISDTIHALRDGMLSGTAKASSVNRDQLVRMMIGRELKELYPYQPRTRGGEMLRLEGFRATTAHTPCSFSLHAGEIVGIAGLIGSGRTELLEAIFGLRQPNAGTISVKGQPIRINSPASAARNGLAFVSESRKEQGLFLESSISENISIISLLHAARRSFRSRATEDVLARSLIQQLSVRCSSPTQPAKLLSGGNQQKVVLARWLAIRPTILLLDEPTRGVDVGARSEIYQLLFKLAAAGMAVLFVSSELEEVMGIADRALIMNQGDLRGELNRSDFSEHALMTIAAQQLENAA